jgi:hypothetical protein
MNVQNYQRTLGSLIAVVYVFFGIRQATTTYLSTFDPLASLSSFAIEAGSWLPFLLAISALLLLWRRKPARLSLWTLSIWWVAVGVINVIDIGFDPAYLSSLIYPVVQTVTSLIGFIYLVAVIERPPTSWPRESALPLTAIIVVFVPQMLFTESFVQFFVINVITYCGVATYDWIYGGQIRTVGR